MPPFRPPVFVPPGTRTAQERNRERMERDRGKRLRGKAAAQRRAFWLSMHPLCATCERAGRVTAATQVDHPIPIEDGGADNESNMASICDACHLVKTNAERAR
jgi:5-methylcytosine-specific restriction protein A